jgi:hypothetical protein
MSPIQTLMPPSQKGLATAVDLSGVEGGDGVIEGHFFELPAAQVKSPPEHDSDGLNSRRRETQPTPQLGEIYCL